MTDLKPGDVVQLRSGGPQMTVEMIHKNGRVDVVWFPKGSLPQTHVFVAAALKKVNFEVGKPKEGGT